jgi:hypothetical protein
MQHAVFDQHNEGRIQRPPVANVVKVHIQASLRCSGPDRGDQFIDQ